MNHAKLVEKIQALPVEKQAEVLDFVDFLALRIKETAHKSLNYDEWTNAKFNEMAMNQALRGMEDEPSLYSFDDLKERWQ